MLSSSPKRSRLTPRAKSAEITRDDLIEEKASWSLPTVGEVKRKLNLAHGEDDKQIDRIITAVMDYFQKATDHMLRKQEREAEYDAVAGWYRLPKGPFVSFDSVVSVREGEETEQDLDNYYTKGGEPRIIKAKDVALSDGNRTRITYTVGYEEKTDVPHGIREGLSKMAVDLYEHRTSAPITGQTLSEAPFNFDRLVAPYTMYSA